MLFSKRILLLLLFFVFSSCDFPTLPSLDLCNTQFRGDGCYIQAMQQDSLSINSYSDNAIIINYLLEDLSVLLADSTISYDSVSVIPDSLIIERKLESDSIYTAFIIPYSDTTKFYLDTMIYDTGLYHYRLATKNENGRSLYDSVSINHQLPPIQNISVGEPTCSNIQILWEYDIDVFSNTYDTLKFQIERILLDTDTTTYNIDLPYSEDNTYEFNNDTFEFGVVYEYKVAFQGNAINSSSAAVQSDIPNPPTNVDSLYWIPISSDIVYVNWNIGGNYNYFDSIKVDNEISDVTYPIYQNKDSPTNAGYLLDSLSTYANGINAGQKVEYTLQWFCKEIQHVEIFNAATLPYNNMVYIPAINNYPYVEISTSGDYDTTLSTSSFYIDIYELTEDEYDDPTSNVPLTSGSMPQGLLSYIDADNFVSNSHPDNNSGVTCDNLDQIQFKIPQDYEWQIASRCQYNWDNKTCDEYFDYPINVIGHNAIISCNFINYSGCCDVNIDYCVQSVDQYPESITPFGLYGTSGNLQEWVVNNNSSISANKLIGGYYSSTHDEVTTKSVHYNYSNSTIHLSYGLRTVFDAKQFLEIWRDCVDP